MMTTQKEVRAAFWRDYKDAPGISPRRITDYSGNGKMYNIATRCAFTEYVDALYENGEISAALAARVTL